MEMTKQKANPFRVCLAKTNILLNVPWSWPVATSQPNSSSFHCIILAGSCSPTKQQSREEFDSQSLPSGWREKMEPSLCTLLICVYLWYRLFRKHQLVHYNMAFHRWQAHPSEVFVRAAQIPSHCQVLLGLSKHRLMWARRFPTPKSPFISKFMLKFILARGRTLLPHSSVPGQTCWETNLL